MPEIPTSGRLRTNVLLAVPLPSAVRVYTSLSPEHYILQSEQQIHWAEYPVRQIPLSVRQSERLHD